MSASPSTPKFDIIRLSATDSTSTEASRRLAQGQTAPFAVLAETQSGGRGRRGRQWTSPLGNIYVTLVLPPMSPESAAASGAIPLKAAVIIARFLEAEFGLRVTLKWPNDLLFAGRKLGGILCEASITGDRPGEVLVGLGLNVSEAPELSGLYEATCLHSLLGPEKAPKAPELAEKLIGFFFKEWANLPLGKVTEAFAAYSIGEGQLWRDSSAEGAGAWAHDRGLSPDGSLRLQKVSPPAALLNLNSADHGYSWVYQGHDASNYPLVVADIGNTSVKLAVYKTATAAQPVLFESLTLETADAAEPLLQRCWDLVPAAGWPLFMISVAHQAAALFSEAAKRQGFQPVTLLKRPVRRHGPGYRLEELGIDRLAVIEGYLASLNGSSQHKTAAAVLVVAGTATTIDVVDLNGLHLGGFILPGISLGLRALHEATSLLPKIDASDETGKVPLELGHHTRSAMMNGAVWMTVAAVERVVEQVAAQLAVDKTAIAVVLSGGHAPLLHSNLSKSTKHLRVDQTLVVSGARVMALGGALLA